MRRFLFVFQNCSSLYPRLRLQYLVVSLLEDFLTQALFELCGFGLSIFLSSAYQFVVIPCQKKYARFPFFRASNRSGPERQYIHLFVTRLATSRINLSKKTTSKLYALRELHFFLAVVLYNLCVLWNFMGKLSVSVYVLFLKYAVRLSWLFDVEADD